MKHKALRVMRTMVDGGQLRPGQCPGQVAATAAHCFATRASNAPLCAPGQRRGIQSGASFITSRAREILRAVMEETIHYNTAMMRAVVTEATNVRERVLALIRCELQSIMGAWRGHGGAGVLMAFAVGQARPRCWP